jgi:predicted nucleotidyltransferase
MKYGLNNTIWERINTVFAAFPEIESAVLYGSRAMGKQRPSSDIDIALHGIGLDLHTVNRISLALDELDLPYLFDLSVYDQIDNESLRGHILRVGVPIYKR